MDRDYKIGIIAGFIVIVAVLLWTENSEYKQCLQAGADALEKESYPTNNRQFNLDVYANCAGNK